ncbi:alpha/beta fold hydrolase [Streptococcus sp. H31]|uniref:alpha/beta fold hydrolase n=1 Tax=Streptococcus huangxiaojuni TaxID=3237239 RepID=UPI0034A43368
MESANELFIEESGCHNTETILFLHASGYSSKMWGYHIAALKSDFHCLAVDLPGHGKSLKTAWTNFDTAAEMLTDIIKKRAHSHPHLVGLSLGASLSLTLLANSPDLVGRVIIDGSGHQPIKGYRAVIAGVYAVSLLKDTHLFARLMTKMMQENGVPEQECRSFIEDLQSTSSQSFRRAMSQANVLKLDLTFDNPAFFVSGGQESETIHESHQWLAKQNAQSECAYYPGKGHAWMLGDPDTHLQLVRYFLQDDIFPNKLKRF